MQLFSRNKAFLALSLGALSVLGACGDDVVVTPGAATVSISPTNTTLNVGEVGLLSVQASGGATAALACTSSNAAVASVTVVSDQCRVLAVAPGNVTITAAKNGGQASASVAVTAAPAAISGLAVTPMVATLAVGQTQTITRSVTSAATAVATTYAFGTSNGAVATVSTTGVITAVAPGSATITVTASGTGAGYTATTLTQNVQITVTSLPTGITSLSVTPTPLGLSVGDTRQLSTSAVQPTGAAAATYSYQSSNPLVATVSGTGLITAVASGAASITVTASSAGNAAFAATSLTQVVPVTVTARAQVSIANITQAETNNPVDINNVTGQIQVALNLVSNAQVITGAQVYVCNVTVPATACPAVGQAPAAQQMFGAGGATSGTINMFINTADFTVASDLSDATVRYTNGQKTLAATLTVADQATTIASNNLAILNFNNTDGFVASHVAPVSNVVAGGRTFFGGPGDAGRGSVTVAPVIYTAGRTMRTITVAMTGCGTSTTFTAGTDARPWRLTYGATATANTKNIGCPYQTLLASDPDVFPTITASTYSDNITGPTVATVAGFKTNTANPALVAAPATIRVDYLAPTAVTYAILPQATGALAGWVNGAYNFAATTNVTATDVGVGVKTASRRIEVAGCPTVSPVLWTALSTNTGADVAECQTNFAGGPAGGPYSVRYIAEDLLLNAAAAVTAANTFGVDKTLPVIRYAAATLAQNTIVSVAPAAGTTLFQAEALDERAGFDDATAATHFLAQANRFLNLGSCLVGSFPVTSPATTNAGASFITAPNCVRAAAGALGAALVDGYRPLPAVAYATTMTEAYYSYSPRVTDRAGNAATGAVRSIAINARKPFSVVANNPLFLIDSVFAGSFTGTFKDSVETALTSLRVLYGTDTLAFPATATTATAFDNLITRDSLVSAGFPFTSGTRFYTSLEYFVGGANVAPASVGFYAGNIGGLGQVGMIPFVAGTITPDNAAWTTAAKVTSLTNYTMIADPNDASFNSPAGGLKARAVGTVNQLSAPFTRVDFYRQATSGAWEFVGSVDGTAAPCVSASQTCSMYIADNGAERVWTYVLRTAGIGSMQLTSLQLNSGTYRAIATKNSFGRALVSAPANYVPPVVP